MNLYTANTHAALWESSQIGSRNPLWLAHFTGTNTAVGYNPSAPRGTKAGGGSRPSATRSRAFQSATGWLL